MFYVKKVYLYIFMQTHVIFMCRCNDEINPCSNGLEIVSDHTDTDCGEGYFFQETGNSIHNCFSQCVKYDLKQPCTDSNPCPPGYTCLAIEGSDPYCQPKENSCFNYKMDSLNPRTDAWKPTCSQDGTWAAKQCKGEANNGRCFCYDTVGNRIFGQAFLDKSTNMTCACSRRKEKLRNEKLRFYTTLHCDSMGNYEPLQCDEGQCWCVESQTGEITSQVIPDTMMTLLPCYSEDEVGIIYMRPCESEKYAQKNILHELNLHGTEHASFPHIMCDDDGNYGYYQIVGGQAYCKWKDNSNIAGFAAEINENIDDLNCYCARDTKIYESAGITLLLLCASNGNYKPLQYHPENEKWYCVDKDGFKSSDFMDEPEDCAPYTT